MKKRRVESETLLTSPTELDLPPPLGLQDLTGRDATGRVGIEDGVDDIATPGLLHSTQPLAQVHQTRPLPRSRRQGEKPEKERERERKKEENIPDATSQSGHTPPPPSSPANTARKTHPPPSSPRATNAYPCA